MIISTQQTFKKKKKKKLAENYHADEMQQSLKLKVK